MEYANMKNTTITRKIGDQYVNFELTDAEMESAFGEFQFQNDVVNVKARLEESGEYENFENIPDELIYAMAKKYREHIEGFAETMGDNSIPSFEATVKEFSEKLEEYKEKWKVFSKEVTLTLTHEYTIKAKNKEQADNIFESWAESNAYQMTEDLCEDAQWNGDFDYGYTYEDDSTNPDYADISEEDI